jgi:hypothetical protein
MRILLRAAELADLEGRGFNAVASVGWTLEREGRVLASRWGHAV